MLLCGVAGGGHGPAGGRFARAAGDRRGLAGVGDVGLGACDPSPWEKAPGGAVQTCVVAVGST